MTLEKKNNKRLSNIELLRIISMFMILVLHANFYALGMPNVLIGAASNKLQIFLMSIFESFADVGVNVFVLISGWFGIKCTLQSGLKFIFQCLFYSCGIFLVLYLCGYIQLSFLGLAECFFLRKINWFPKAYLCLFIFAPLLNIFVETASRRQQKNTLIAFFVFQTIFGCISDATTFISFGYSTISFFGLYLLARYIRIFKPNFSQKSLGVDLSIYVMISTALALVASFLIQHEYYSSFYRINAYCNPFVIISSTFLLLAFTKIKFTSSIINTIAASCFSVYLIHSNPNIIENFYIFTIQKIHLNGGEFEILFIFLFLITFFIGSVLIDQIRIFCWNMIMKIRPMNNKKATNVISTSNNSDQHE